MTRPKPTVIYAIVLLLGLTCGAFIGGYFASSSSEKYFREVHNHARFIQAKERATVLRLLDESKTEEAKNVLYVVLAANFDDYNTSSSSAEQACDLLNVMGASALTDKGHLVGDHEKSHRYLVESVRAATVKCKKAEK